MCIRDSIYIICIKTAEGTVESVKYESGANVVIKMQKRNVCQCQRLNVDYDYAMERGGREREKTEKRENKRERKLMK